MLYLAKVATHTQINAAVVRMRGYELVASSHIVSKRVQPDSTISSNYSSTVKSQRHAAPRPSQPASRLPYSSKYGKKPEAAGAEAQPAGQSTGKCTWRLSQVELAVLQCGRKIKEIKSGASRSMFTAEAGRAVAT